MGDTIPKKEKKMTKNKKTGGGNFSYLGPRFRSAERVRGANINCKQKRRKSRGVGGEEHRRINVWDYHPTPAPYFVQHTARN